LGSVYKKNTLTLPKINNYLWQIFQSNLI